MSERVTSPLAQQAVVENAGPAVQVSDLVAALRDLGWPEPDTLSEVAAYWKDRDGVYVERLDDGVEINYGAPDEETGTVNLRHASFTRVVTAVDRLRWVLGLPERGAPIVAASERPSEATSVWSSLASAVARLHRSWEPVA